MSKNKRVFYNRRWKADDFNELEICQDSYTDNELNICIGTGVYAVWTMIKKTALLNFAKELEAREIRVFSNHSDYESAPYFEAILTDIGYSFITKSVIMNSIELPFSKVDKVIDFLKFNCK